jgi:GNAT superfamily N-acetyltransferase
VDFRTVERNLRESFRLVAACRDGGEIREVAGVEIASAGAAFQMFNAAFLSAPVTSAVDLDRRILSAAVHFRERRQDWAFWVCHGLVERQPLRRMANAFERERLYPAAELPGMGAERLLPPHRELPSFEVRRVGDEPTRLAFCDIGAACFHVPIDWFREIFLAEPVWREGFAGFVGYAAGEPVVTAATVTTLDAVGVYNVSTLPAFRRRGYGEALVRYALESARRQTGCERTILQSTPQGLALYERMGYQTLTTVSVFASGG